MSEFKVRPVDSFSAELKVPGDKSISHRAVMFAALSNGTCEIDGFLPSEDCLATVGALKQLGVEIKSLNEDATKLVVQG
ncbi:MAG: 3-phosphoshikimate 1-carboxyvinyltransferase, partial [Verrucomicrobiales bacterium]|nr:3-phosphoshikimate 1-carboxyvinyltransferase [Verrucomicrobiales bacterium]